MFYLVRTPAWVKKVFPGRLWEVNTTENSVFLSFDDGPHPEATPFVLDELKRYGATATFFCIGKNVEAYPDLYRRIIEEGHSVGNHTFNHLKGTKTIDSTYLQDILHAKQFIHSKLFRPPYGRVSNFIVEQIKQPLYDLTTVMWTVLSGDFDTGITREQCLQNVLLNTKAGSIVVFHDSEKAFGKMKYALPKTLAYFSAKGFRFERIPVIEDKKNGPG
ncbi:MAG: polysaccharide deacetylase family protein [Chitinophagaceae bacterium]|nr:MAG: polysaccharide deacetylase family protein [Chitinophagaceae bacterium]